MTLSIVTINRNNAEGLENTMQSVLSQTCKDFEYIVIDGASSDNSKEIIIAYAEKFGDRLKWISEKDKGIYNAMNKGISIATGEYLEFLNSGDCLVNENVVSKMLDFVSLSGRVPIIYGNMLKNLSSGRILRDRCFAGKDITLLGMYRGCLNHSPAYIKKELFDKYGLYNESLQICSDWEWYTKSIVFGNEKTAYVDIDVTLFDMTGISERNKDLLQEERNNLLKEMVPQGILTDYDNWYLYIDMVKRINRFPIIFTFFKFVERCLFKFEKITKKEKVKL